MKTADLFPSRDTLSLAAHACKLGEILYNISTTSHSAFDAFHDYCGENSLLASTRFWHEAFRCANDLNGDHVLVEPADFGNDISWVSQGKRQFLASVTADDQTLRFIINCLEALTRAAPMLHSDRYKLAEQLNAIGSLEAAISAEVQRRIQFGNKPDNNK